jgi:ribonuclease HII
MPGLYSFDEAQRRQAGPLLAGVDEAGRGPWAGPVAAAAVILRPESRFQGLNDSKQVAPEIRERLFEEIRRDALFYAVALVEAAAVDELNILQATFLAMRRALAGLAVRPDRIIVDGNRTIPEVTTRQEAVVKGDSKSASVAAASILAKVTRDRLMTAAHERFPLYGFNEHKGYGTPVHAEALRRFGPCPLHRRSFAPVRDVISPPLPFELPA